MPILCFEDSGESNSLPELHLGITRLDSESKLGKVAEGRTECPVRMFLAGQLFGIIGRFEAIAVNRMDVLLQPRQHVCFLPLI